MDRMTIIGLGAVMGTIYYVLSSENILHILFNPMAAVLVFGGTLSAALIAYPWEVIREVFPSFRQLIFSNKNFALDRLETIDTLVGLSEKSRRSGIESLQEELPKISDRTLARGIQMVIDGIDPEVLKDNMEKETFYLKQRQRNVSSVFRTMATLAPIFGLLGTLIGVVKMLQNLSNPEDMGNAMASAVTATFYGIFVANVFIPVAIKLSGHNERDIVMRELATEGVMAIQQGDLPLMVRKKLNAFAENIEEKKEIKKTNGI